MKFKRLLFLFFILILSFSVFAACSNSSPDSAGNDISNEQGTDGSGVMPDSSQRKIVYNITADICTGDFGKAVETINTETASSEGYIESSEIGFQNGYHTAHYKLKIKTVNLQTFLDKFSVLGEVSSQKTTSRDITLEYSSVQAELEAYETELALLQQKAETETDTYKLFEYTNRITQLNTKLNNFKNQLKAYDSIVDFSMVEIYIYEKGAPITQKPYGTEVGDTFRGSLNFLLEVLKFILLAIIALAPYAVTAFVLYFCIRYLIRYLKKHFPKRFAKKPKPVNFRGNAGYWNYNPYNQSSGTPYANMQGSAREEAPKETPPQKPYGEKNDKKD